MAKNDYKAYTLDVWYSEDGENNYRIIKVSGEDTLDDLSEFILDSFDFDHDHMYAFSTDGNIYGEESYHLNDPEHKSTKTQIKKVLTKVDERLIYLFDFGDEWVFAIDVKEIENIDKKIKPKLIESVGTLEQYPDFDEEDY
ncbi:MAG: plasmid pRiA4b ORF-3 family protein [Methanobrevibacter sp.]|jgi:hypothetical protein|nr:plasmid pRiA4b ORF-3 family protein [Methanobrevibacter sp.]